LALVPPAAFAAVPDSPPPNPKGKRHKTKVVASPIGPFALFAHKTGKCIFILWFWCRLVVHITKVIK